MTAARPPSPDTTCVTTSPVGRDRKAIALARPTSADEVAALPLAAVNCSIRFGSVSKPVTL
jgi:hypothetical protein